MRTANNVAARGFIQGLKWLNARTGRWSLVERRTNSHAKAVSPAALLPTVYLPSASGALPPV